MLYYAQIAVLIYGVFAMGYALRLSVQFHATHNKAFNALFVMLLCVSVICGITIWFASTSFLNTYNVMSPLQAILLRVALFTAVVLGCYKLRTTFIR